MQVDGTEVGLGIGALLTSVLTYFGLRSKKEDPLLSLRKEIEKIKGRQDRFEDSLKSVMDSNKKDMAEMSNDFHEMKADIRLMTTSLNNMALSLARLNAFQEVSEHEKKTP